MKGRLVVPTSLVWAVLFAAAGVGGSACSSSDSATMLDPAGPPAVKELFVNARIGNGLPANDPGLQGNDPGSIDSNDLAWGIMRDVGLCTFDNMCPTSMGFPSGYTCNLDLRICLSADGQQTGTGGASLVQDGIIWDTAGGLPIIQIVFKELLDGATMERFACACAKVITVSPTGVVSLATGNCGGNDFTLDTNCADCPDNPDTSDNEAGACFDVNSDGVADLPSLLPGLVSITCAGTNYAYTSGGVSCARVSAAGVPAAVAPDACDGFYDPSGNQIVTIDKGYLGVGPRLYLYPAFGAGGPFPADSDCELTVSNTIKDKDGLAMAAPATPLKWHTEVVQRIASDPEGKTVPSTDPTPPPEVPAPETIQVSMNTLLNPASVAVDTITVTAEPEPQTTPPTVAVAVAGSTALDPDDATLLVWTPAAPLAENQKYTVTVAAGIEDTFGKPLASDDVFEFVVVPATPASPKN